MILGQFSLVPRSVTTLLNRQVQFNCGTDATGHTLKWEVDGIKARLLHSRNISSRTDYDPSSQSAYYAMSTLSITASLANNNSETTCILSVFGGGEVARASAFLYVQGNKEV